MEKIIEKEEEKVNEEINESKDEVVEKKLKKKKKVAGIVYLSSIPTKMNVKLIRDYFNDYGVVDRIYLQPEGLLFHLFLF
jgi:hypothetical protein